MVEARVCLSQPTHSSRTRLSPLREPDEQRVLRRATLERTHKGSLQTSVSLLIDAHPTLLKVGEQRGKPYKEQRVSPAARTGMVEGSEASAASPDFL